METKQINVAPLSSAEMVKDRMRALSQSIASSFVLPKETQDTIRACMDLMSEIIATYYDDLFKNLRSTINSYVETLKAQHEDTDWEAVRAASSC